MANQRPEEVDEKGKTMLPNQVLQDIFQSYREINGHWPSQYVNFYNRWGYFNQVYDTLYSHDKEWKRIAAFSMNHSNLWPDIEAQAGVISALPCVGNGRGANDPTLAVRVSSNTLRIHFSVDATTICNQQNWKCSTRQTRCSEMTFQPAPFIIDINNPSHGVYTLLGATLTIVYQIRNNLFHGSKHEFFGDEFNRNLQLVEVSDRIVEIILDRISR